MAFTKIESTATADTSPWLVLHRPNAQARLRLYCFPHAGGAATTFLTWPARLPQTIEVCSIQLPGHGSRVMEEPLDLMSTLVETLAREIFPHDGDQPFAFYGHSMGAMISFELARKLRRQYGQGPVHLFVAGSHAPQTPDPFPISHLPEPEFIEELRRLNGLPREIMESRELLRLLLPTLRADCAITENYSYRSEAPVSCPISVFGGLRDPLVNREQLGAWREQTSASFSLLMLPGDHFFTTTSQTLLLQALSRKLHPYTRSIAT